MTRYLVTSALPYANGPIHFGHVVGAYLPADVYVRTLRMQGEDVRFICGSDEYGVAITLGAEREGTPYGEYAAKWHDEIESLFDRLGIRFDVFSGTSTCPFHEETSQDFFRKLDAGGYLKKQAAEQLFSASQGRFLADRYVVGVCPKCSFENARGDECPNCGSWLDPLELGDPRSKIDGEPLEKRRTTHWYLDLERLRDEHVQEWFEGRDWKPNVEAYVRAQLAEIHERPITRDLDWGVPVPEDLRGEEEGKVLYVWFDAPIGYVSMTREWAEREGRPEAWKDYWKSEDTRLVHFIGKDNIPFHCVVFPSMLHGVKDGYVLPWAVPANEFYNLQGRKFSTSEGWSIPLDEFFEKYDSEVTRFYLLSSAPETADSEWRWEGFQSAANTGLADTIGNLATRVLRFIDKHFEGRVPAVPAALAEEMDRVILTECGSFADPAEHVREFRFRRAAEQLIENARVANVFVDKLAPWKLRKEDPERAGAALATCCEWIAWVARWMAPFLPSKAQALWAMVGRTDAVAEQPWPGVPKAGSWRCLEPGSALGEVQALFPKIDDETIAAEVAALEARAPTPE